MKGRTEFEVHVGVHATHLAQLQSQVALYDDLKALEKFLNDGSEFRVKRQYEHMFFISLKPRAHGGVLGRELTVQGTEKLNALARAIEKRLPEIIADALDECAKKLETDKRALQESAGELLLLSAGLSTKEGD